MLNDEVINQFVAILAAKYTNIHFFNTHFYKKLTESWRGYEYKKVKIWTKGVDVFSKVPSSRITLMHPPLILLL